METFWGMLAGEDETDETDGVDDCERSDSDLGCCNWSSDSVDVVVLVSVNRSAGAVSF